MRLFLSLLIVTLLIFPNIVFSFEIHRFIKETSQLLGQPFNQISQKTILKKKQEEQRAEVVYTAYNSGLRDENDCKDIDFHFKRNKLSSIFCNTTENVASNTIDKANKIYQDKGGGVGTGTYYWCVYNKGIEVAVVTPAINYIAIHESCPSGFLDEYRKKIDEIEKLSTPQPIPNLSSTSNVYVQPFKRPGGHEIFINSLKDTYEFYYLMLKMILNFPDFNIYFKYCGQENAFSTPDIIICNEYVAKLVNSNHEEALPWIFFHEVGHSLLRLWDYPLWDNEDAADEIATVLLLLMTGEMGRDIALEAIRVWETYPSFFESISKTFINDRHTISIQRARNISMWIKNSDDLKRRWSKMLVLHMRTELLKGTRNNPEPWMDEKLIELIEKELQKRKT